MRRRIPLLTRRLASFHPKDFWEFVTGLYQKQKNETSVPGVRISFGGKVTQVRITDRERKITEAELALLAEEYERTIEELRELLKKRKIEVTA